MARALQSAGKAPTVQRYNLRGNKRDNPEFLLQNSAQAPLLYRLFGERARAEFGCSERE